MLVLKFGGTSVGSVENLRKVADIVTNTFGVKIVVLSAMSGVTNSLQRITDLIKWGKINDAKIEIENLNKKYQHTVYDLFGSGNRFKESSLRVSNFNDVLLSFLDEEFSDQLVSEILAQGELVSTYLFQILLEENQENSKLISALDFMRIDSSGEPVLDHIRVNLLTILQSNNNVDIFITQGFICRNSNNDIDNLKRGGSDYTASLIGAALAVDEIQIWTDIDGMHNNDPRFVENTFSIEEISFDEAAELAYFGAKILHPQSIIPAKEKNIPVLVKNTFNPESPGTLIHDKAKVKKIRAIAAKDNITAIKIKSYRMLMAYGFLMKIFEVFEKNETAIDMITTSEVAVSLTIDNTKKLDRIIEELQSFGNIEVESDQSIICIAGDLAQNKKGVTSAIFNCIDQIPIRMISYGGSNYNLSFLVKTADKISVLNLLNDGLFSDFKKVESKKELV